MDTQTAQLIFDFMQAFTFVMATWLVLEMTTFLGFLRTFFTARNREVVLALCDSMGVLAKAGGHVSQAEIDAAESEMGFIKIGAQLAPSGVSPREMIDAFYAGRDRGSIDKGLVERAARVMLHPKWHPLDKDRTIKRFILALQSVASADVQSAWVASSWDTYRALQEIMAILAKDPTPPRLGKEMLENLERFSPLEYGRATRDDEYRASAGGLNWAYERLQVTSGASFQQIKAAYRRLIGTHHPDKVAARGGNEKAVEAAKRITQEIIDAYRALKQAA